MRRHTMRSITQKRIAAIAATAFVSLGTAAGPAVANDGDDEQSKDRTQIEDARVVEANDLLDVTDVLNGDNEIVKDVLDGDTNVLKDFLNGNLSGNDTEILEDALDENDVDVSDVIAIGVDNDSDATIVTED